MTKIAKTRKSTTSKSSSSTSTAKKSSTSSRSKSPTTKKTASTATKTPKKTTKKTTSTSTAKAKKAAPKKTAVTEEKATRSTKTTKKAAPAKKSTAKKAAAPKKATTTKKAAAPAKKSTAKKAAAPKKTTKKAAAPEKAAASSTKTSTAKKSTAKKTAAPKKATTTKKTAAPKKASTAKKSSTKKTVKTKETVQAATLTTTESKTKKAAPKKAAPKKAAPKKAAPKKAAPKKAAPEKAAAPKKAPKKATPKKAASKKAVAPKKAATSKKAVVKKEAEVKETSQTVKKTTKKAAAPKKATTSKKAAAPKKTTTKKATTSKKTATPTSEKKTATAKKKPAAKTETAKKKTTTKKTTTKKVVTKKAVVEAPVTKPKATKAKATSTKSTTAAKKTKSAKTTTAKTTATKTPKKAASKKTAAKPAAATKAPKKASTATKAAKKPAAKTTTAKKKTTTKKTITAVVPPKFSGGEDVRVFLIARELRRQSSLVMKQMKALGVEVSHYQNGIAEDIANRLYPQLLEMGYTVPEATSEAPEQAGTEEKQSPKTAKTETAPKATTTKKAKSTKTKTTKTPKKTVSEDKKAEKPAKPAKKSSKKATKTAETKPAKKAAQKAPKKSSKTQKSAEAVLSEPEQRGVDLLLKAEGDPIEQFAQLTRQRVDAPKLRRKNRASIRQLREDRKHARSNEEFYEDIAEELVEEEQIFEMHERQERRNKHQQGSSQRRGDSNRRDSQRRHDSRRQGDSDRRDHRSKKRSPWVRIKVFHPDADAGGHYITQVVHENEIPPGAKVIGSAKGPEDVGGYSNTERQPRSNQSAPFNQNFNEDPWLKQPDLPGGGILDAGRRFLQRRKAEESQKEVVETQENTAETVETQAVAKTAENLPEKTTLAKEEKTEKKSEADGLGSGFLSGLPVGMGTKSPQGAMAALNSMFSTPGAKKEEAVAASATAPKAHDPRPPVVSKKPLLSHPVTVSRETVVIDGRTIESPLSQKTDNPVLLTEVSALPVASDALRVFDLSLKTQGDKTLDGHLLLWPEGALEVRSQVNDNDPRPVIVAEEGILGMGHEQREKSVQRRSMREWWERLVKRGESPLAGFAGSRVVRDADQVAFVHDPDYNIYRLYQRGGVTLKGTHSFVYFVNGELKTADVCLDDVQEKERFTPERMKALFGSHFSAETPFSVAMTALSFFEQGQALDLAESSRLEGFRDQLNNLFRFPALELPNPIGGGGSIRVLLGLWEMSQDNEHARQLREAASRDEAVVLQASAGVLSDLVRRELWRTDGDAAREWAGYTPRQVAKAIRLALREDHHNMQGFTPKKPGDYRYNDENGEFQIVLRRHLATHTLLLRGVDAQGDSMLGALVVYGKLNQEGVNPLVEYGRLLLDNDWTGFQHGLRWLNGWLTAPRSESRCLWAIAENFPITPAVSSMPAWDRGVAQGLFLVQPSSVADA